MINKDPKNPLAQARAYRVREACAVMRIGKTKIHRMLSNGELRSVKVGRCRLIPADAVEALLTGGDH
ncbi:MAG: excisionase family DNA-binding protein [Caulobacteraceae bacterium]|nr:excisionase family DNA-binding protein [Caulobacteraceae bacterium]